MTEKRSPLAEVFKRNPWARFPAHRGTRVLYFPHSPIMLVQDAARMPEDSPGFATEFGGWVTCPFHDGQGAECDPMDEWGFKLGQFTSDADPVAEFHLSLQDDDRNDVYLTDALNTGLPTGENDYCLHTSTGRLISFQGDTYMVLNREAQKCDRCGEPDTSCSDYRVFWANRNRGQEMVLCCGCFAALSEPEDDEPGVDAVIPSAAFHRALESISIDAFNFNVGVAAMQEAMGFQCGDWAGVWWSGKEDDWREQDKAGRLTLLDDYVRYEARRLADERAEAAADAHMDALGRGTEPCPGSSDGSHLFTWSDNGLEVVCDSCSARRRSTDQEILDWVELQRESAREEALLDAQRAVKEVQ